MKIAFKKMIAFFLPVEKDNIPLKAVNIGIAQKYLIIKTPLICFLY